MKKIKWGIIGLGEIAHQFASQFESDHAELTSVASRTLQQAYDFSQIYNVKNAYGSYEELAYDPEIDVVYVATPNSYHYENMLMLLKAGKHVLCEKSIALNQKQLTTVLELAESKKLIIAEAMTLYHMPLFKELKQNIAVDKYGKVIMVHALFGSKPTFDPTNRFYSPELGGGALLDIGVYALSFIRFFLSSQPVVRQTTVSFSETRVDMNSAFHFKNKQGQIATASLSFQSEMPVQGIIICEHAYIEVQNYPRATHAIVTYSDGTTEEVNCGDTEKALTYEIEAITQTLLSENNYTSIRLTKDVNALIDWAAKEWDMGWIFDDK